MLLLLVYCKTTFFWPELIPLYDNDPADNNLLNIVLNGDIWTAYCRTRHEGSKLPCYDLRILFKLSPWKKYQTYEQAGIQSWNWKEAFVIFMVILGQQKCILKSASKHVTIQFTIMKMEEHGNGISSCFCSKVSTTQTINAQCGNHGSVEHPPTMHFI